MPHLPIEPLQDSCRQQRDVFAPLTQGWNDYAHDVETVEQVLAEDTIADTLFQILVGSGNNAGIDRHGGGSAKPGDFPVLQHTQDLYLQRERHIADLIEKKCASAGQFEHTGLARNRTGKRSFLIPEKLAFQKVLGHPADIDGHKGAILHRTGSMDLTGNHFFSGAAFTGDQDGGVCIRNLADYLLDPLDRGALADKNLFVLIGVVPRLALHQVAQMLGFHQFFETNHQFFGVEGLYDIVLGSFLEC